MCVCVCVTNNLIKHLLFVHKQLNSQNVLILTIRFNVVIYCAQFKWQNVLFDQLLHGDTS